MFVVFVGPPGDTPAKAVSGSKKSQSQSYRSRDALKPSAGQRQIRFGGASSVPSTVRSSIRPSVIRLLVECRKFEPGMEPGSTLKNT